jgi:sorbitol/mannitol transport system substrate-binding protein
MTLKAIDSADPGLDGNSKPKPYIGVQYTAIPEFQVIATAVVNNFPRPHRPAVNVERARQCAGRLQRDDQRSSCDQ